MNKIVTLSLIGASALSLVAGAASAQPWQHNGQHNGQNNSHWTSINERQVQLDRRIDQGVRTGQLSRPEAMRLRGEFRQIARVEQNYRKNGLSNWERADLDRRFDRLAAQIRVERRDNQYGQGYGNSHGYDRDHYRR